LTIKLAPLTSTECRFSLHSPARLIGARSPFRDLRPQTGPPYHRPLLFSRNDPRRATKTCALDLCPSDIQLSKIRKPAAIRCQPSAKSSPPRELRAVC
jgi:hypothetical protein